VKKIFNLALGIVTSIGGFAEVGSISTSVQAVAEFRFSLLWAVAAATLFVAALAEMAGRMAAVSKRPLAAAVRECFGFHFQIIPLSAELGTDMLLLTAELGGVAIAIKMLTGIGFQWWILPVGLVAWLLLWLGNFSVIEDGVGSKQDLGINRLTAWLGMGFGSTVAMGCLITAAVVLGPQHVKVDTYEQAALMFVPVYGRWAVTLFALSLGIGCFGAAVEIALNSGYVLGQALGWT